MNIFDEDDRFFKELEQRTQTACNWSRWQREQRRRALVRWTVVILASALIVSLIAILGD